MFLLDLFAYVLFFLMQKNDIVLFIKTIIKLAYTSTVRSWIFYIFLQGTAQSLILCYFTNLKDFTITVWKDLVFF